MAIKFAQDIVREIRERGSIEVPEGYVTGEDFENWLYGEEQIFMDAFENVNESEKNTIMPTHTKLNRFYENYGDAA